MSIDHRNPPFKKGDKICRVEIQRLIGSGGQGFVYEGKHDFFKKPVAVKAIPNTSDTTRNLRQRAENEAGILFDLQHPNILRVTDAAVTDDGVVCIVMELLKGRSLRSMLHELNRIRADEALLIGAQIAEGVQAAHEAQAIHRDLKPENVYIEPGNVVKVLDFGIAKIVGIGAVTTQENLIQGTVQYMSPEHLQGRPVTVRSDVFALGCILYELMSGSTPAVIGAESVTMHVAGWNQLMLMPPQLDAVADNVPVYVARAVQLMLAKEPIDRPATMAQVASELRALYARYTKNNVCVLRELWRAGAGAAPPLPERPIPLMATTTVPDAARPQNAEEVVASLVRPTSEEQNAAASAHPIVNVTKPLPLMVRNPEPRIARNVASEPKPPMTRSVPASPEPSVVVQDIHAIAPPTSAVAPAAQPSTSNAQQNSLSRAIVAGAGRIVAQQRTQQKSAGTGDPVIVAARKKPPPVRIHWHKLVAAVGAGSLAGAVVLFGLVWSSNHRDAKADSSAEARGTIVGPPKTTSPPSAMTARPAPSGTGSMGSEPSAAAATPANTPAALPRPQLATRRQPRPPTSEPPASTKSVPSAKPSSRKAKAPAGKLPFSGDELTF